MTGTHRKSEDDVAGDAAVAETRATGGDADQRPREGGTTGTTVAEEFVGRVAGDEDFSGETGAERRAANQ